MPASSPSYASSGEMNDTHGPVWPSCRLLQFAMNERGWIQPNGTSPLPSGGRGNEAWRRLSEVSQSQSSTDPVNRAVWVKLKKEKRQETAETALVSVWIMMGEWVTVWLHRSASQSIFCKKKNAVDWPDEFHCAKSEQKVHVSISFHLLGYHQAQEVPSLQNHQETPEHTNRIVM